MRKLGQSPSRTCPRHRAQRRSSRPAAARTDHHAVLVHDIVAARPDDLAALELEVPLAGPWSQMSGGDPAGAVADHDARKQDRGDRNRRAAEVRPARIPRFAVDALRLGAEDQAKEVEMVDRHVDPPFRPPSPDPRLRAGAHLLDRKSTRLNSSHVAISYAVFCLKKKKQ